MNLELGEYQLYLARQWLHTPVSSTQNASQIFLLARTIQAFTGLIHIFRLSQGQTFWPKTCLTHNFSQQLRFLTLDDSLCIQLRDSSQTTKALQ